MREVSDGTGQGLGDLLALNGAGGKGARTASRRISRTPSCLITNFTYRFPEVGQALDPHFTCLLLAPHPPEQVQPLHEPHPLAPLPAVLQDVRRPVRHAAGRLHQAGGWAAREPGGRASVNFGVWTGGRVHSRVSMPQVGWRASKLGAGVCICGAALTAMQQAHP